MAADQVFGFGFRIWAKNETKRPAEAAAQQMRKVGRSVQKAGDAAQRSGRKFRKMSNEGLKPATKATHGLRNSMLGLVAATAAFFALRGVSKIFKSFTAQAQTTENQILVLTSVMGSATKGVEAYKFAVKKAAETPFEIEDVVDGFKQLQAFGIDTTKHLDLVGNMAFSMGKSLDDAVQGVNLATMGQLRTLRQQFAVNTFEMKKWTKGLEAGSVQYKEAVLSYLSTITRFQGGMLRAQGSLKVIVSNIGDFFTRMKIEMVGLPGEGRFTDAWKGLLKNILKTFEGAEEKIKVIMAVVGQAMSTVIDNISRAFDWAFSGIQQWINATSSALTDQKRVVLPFLLWLEFTFIKVGRIMGAFIQGWKDGSAAISAMRGALAEMFGDDDKLAISISSWQEFAETMGRVASGILLVAEAFTTLGRAFDLYTDLGGFLTSGFGTIYQTVSDIDAPSRVDTSAILGRAGQGAGEGDTNTTIGTIVIQAPNIETQDQLAGGLEQLGNEFTNAIREQARLEREREGNNR